MLNSDEFFKFNSDEFFKFNSDEFKFTSLQGISNTGMFEKGLSITTTLTAAIFFLEF